jgi:hypothetical protein
MQHCGPDRARDAPPGHPSRAARIAPWFVGALCVLVVHRFSLAGRLDLVQADPIDTRFVAFILEHWTAVFAGRASWRDPPFFYPAAGTIAYSDLLFGMGLLHAGLRQLGLGTYAALNASLLLWSAFAFAACHAFLRRGIGLGRWGCCTGAAFFAAGWPRVAQMPHAQLQVGGLLPLLAMLAVIVLRDGAELSRRAVLAAACAAAGVAALLAATSIYLALFFAWAAVLAALPCLGSGRLRRHLGRVARRQAAPLAAAGALLAALLAPAALAYAPLLRTGTRRGWAEVAASLPDPATLLWMGPANRVWGWVAALFPAAAERSAAEGQLGTGSVVTAIWLAALAWAAARLWRIRACPAPQALAAVLIATGGVLQLCMLRWPGGASAWWWVHRFVPGMGAIRAVPRLQLVIMLPMAVAVGLAADRARRAASGRPVLTAALLAVLLLGAAEQLGSSLVFSGRAAERLADRVAGAIPPGCPAFYAVAPREAWPPALPDVPEAAFDAAAYLAANPDVARAWGGTAWEHYDRYGRHEYRALDPAVARRHEVARYFYVTTVLGAVARAGVPTVNGYSGLEPPGYDLGDPYAPDREQRLARWLARNAVPPGRVCVVTVAIDPADLTLRRAWLR